MDFLFDIGNVIVGVDFIPALKRLIPADAQNVDERLNQLLEHKDEFEAGRVSPEEYFPWAANTLGFKGSHEQFLEAWVDIFSDNTPMWKSIQSLHEAGHRLILFSNINNPHKEFLLKHYPVFDFFTGGIFSYQTGHIKPEAEIYQIAIKQYGLDPASTGYIDDLPANIEGGKNAGLVCHQYDVNHHDKYLTWLNKLIDVS